MTQRKKPRMPPKENITHPAALKMFQILVDELYKDDKLNRNTQMIIDNIALLEQVKQALIEDVRERGVVEFFVNGSQEMYRDNKSIDKILKIVEQQRKLQAELKLTPASDKKVSGAVNAHNDFNEF